MILKKVWNLLFVVAVAALGSLEAREPEVGDIIRSANEEYTLISAAGEGHFSKVYIVKSSSGADYAVKWYKGSEPESSSFFNVLGSAEREYERGQIFDHPHIIRSYDLFFDVEDVDQEHPCVLLELVEGSTIAKLSRQALPEAKALVACIDFAKTLEFALDQGYIYLDMHTNNMMVDNNNSIKIIDVSGFFKWDELARLLFDSTEVSESEYTLQSSEISYYETVEKRINRNFEPKRAKVLKKFVRENSDFLSKSSLKSSLTATSEVDTLEIFKDYFSKRWFNTLTEGLTLINLKNDADRAERMDLRGRIKKIAWDCEEDMLDGLNYPLKHYFDRLNALLEEQRSLS